MGNLARVSAVSPTKDDEKTQSFMFKVEPATGKVRLGAPMFLDWLYVKSRFYVCFSKKH
jgi:hypothetical protein